MKFTLTIDCDNAAFFEPNMGEHEPAAEIASILAKLGARLMEDQAGSRNHLPAKGNARDSNGNAVGAWKIDA